MESEAVKSALKKQLEAMEEVMKSINETQKELQTAMYGLKCTVESVNHMSQAGCETPKEVCQDLLKAAKSGDVNTTKILFKYSNDNCTEDDKYRNTPLIVAAIYGHVEVVRVLLEGGAGVDRVNDCGRTALHLAAQYGRVEVVRVLLEGGADIDRPNAYGSTALHLAGGYGRLDVCRLLLECGANVDHLNKWNDTPLYYAARWGHLSVVKLLVEKEADVSVKGYEDRTASDVARFHGHEDVADWLDSVTRG